MNQQNVKSQFDETQLYRVLHKLLPLYVNDTFHYAVEITLRTGWKVYHFFVPRVQTTLAKYSF